MTVPSWPVSIGEAVPSETLAEAQGRAVRYRDVLRQVGCLDRADNWDGVACPATGAPEHSWCVVCRTLEGSEPA